MKLAPPGNLLTRLAASAIICVIPSFAANASQLVQVGDLVLRIPDSVRVGFDPENPNQKPRFDYTQHSPKTAEQPRQVDTVFIKLEELWPMEQRKRGPVLAIDANTQAPKLDLFCRSPSRAGTGPDTTKAIRKDGPFYVYKEPLAAGEVYINEGDLKIFGGTATSWVYKDPLAEMTYPREAENYTFASALTDVTRLSVSVVTYQVSVEEMPRMFDALERQLRSWLVEPDAQDFRWYHQRPGACEN